MICPLRRQKRGFARATHRFRRRGGLLQQIVLLGLFSLMAAGLVAQEEPTFRSQTNLVLVPTLVRDSSDHAVYGLQAKDFILEDNGVAQTVHLDEEPEAEPLSIVVAILTGDMKRELSEIRGLNSMLGPILQQPETEIAIVESAGQIHLAQDFTSDDTKIQQALQNLEPGGSAAILDAVEYSVNLLDKLPKERRRVLLLISETRDHGSRWAKIDDVVRLIGSSNTAVYALVFSPALSQLLDPDRGKDPNDWGNGPDLIALAETVRQAMRTNTAKAIAAETGGEYRLFESRQGFERHVLDFTNHLHSRYMLSFQPQNPQPGLHQIRVRLAGPGANNVLARRSYWASAGSDRGDSRAEFVGTWQTRISPATEKPSATLNISVIEGIAGGTMVLVNADGTEITSSILDPALNGATLAFKTTSENGTTFSWHLSLRKDGGEGILHGSAGEIVMEEPVFKQH
jgi:VWFA-related protein